MEANSIKPRFKKVLDSVVSSGHVSEMFFCLAKDVNTGSLQYVLRYSEVATSTV